MWRGKGGVISTAALLLYTVPVYFLVIPFYLLMHKYGLIDTLWAVIAANVTFAVPYALLILQWYGRLIPIELDDAARIDGATPVQVYTRIYLPLMMPAVAIVSVFAFITAWNEYLYQFILLSSPGSKTVAITLATFFDNEDTPWNYPVAASLIYALPPIALFFAIRRYIAAGLTLGRLQATRMVRLADRRGKHRQPCFGRFPRTCGYATVPADPTVVECRGGQ